MTKALKTSIANFAARVCMSEAISCSKHLRDLTLAEMSGAMLKHLCCVLNCWVWVGIRVRVSGGQV